MLLSKKNAHERDGHIHFEEGPHVYTIKKRKGFTSVTTFVHTHFWPFNPNYIIDRMMRSPKWPQSEYYGMSKEAIKAAWKKNGAEASSAGTKLHADIEYYYNEEPRENLSVEYQYFLEFQKTHELKPYRTEWNIYDEELKFAGSIDMVAEAPDGTLLIYDWKRCKKIEKNNTWKKFSKNKSIAHIPDTNFWHYSLQLNVYKAVLERNYKKKVSGMFLVCLHPDNFNQSFLRYEVGDMTPVIETLFNDRINQLK